MAVTSLATVASACFTGVIIGVFLMSEPAQLSNLSWVLTCWGGGYAAGGIISVAVGLPTVAILEKTAVIGVPNV
jgi:hypothetical protein